MNFSHDWIIMKKLIDKMFGKPFIIVPNRESILERNNWKNLFNEFEILHLLRSLPFAVFSQKYKFYATILLTKNSTIDYNSLDIDI